MTFDSELLIGMPPQDKCIWSHCNLDLKMSSVHLCPKLHQSCKYSEIPAHGL